MTTIDKTFNGKKVQAQKGDVIEVKLAENSTSGYLWKIKSLDEKHLNYIEEKNEISNEAPGAGGVRIFSIKVIEKGVTELQFSLGNQWENDTVETFKVTIDS